jgi:Zn-dependent M28 family amino/carboxypeptidase
MRRVVFGLAWVCVALFARPAHADAIEDVINQVTVAEYQSYLRVLAGVDPVYPGVYLPNRWAVGDGGNIAGDWITSQFQGFGLSTFQQIFNYSYSPNVVAEITGTTRPQDVYVICAHYDTLANTVGADDNGSGTAAVLTAARILSQYQFEGTLRFIAFSGEEDGLLGSRRYAQAVHSGGENIAGVINLDMILHPGWDSQEPDPDYDLDILTNAASSWLAQELVAKYAAYTPIDVEVSIDNYGNSDHSPFWEYGYSAIRLTEHTTPETWYQGSNAEYHQPTDVYDNPHLDWEFGRHVVRGGMAELIDLAGLVVPEPGTAVLAALGVLVIRRRGRVA